MRQRGYVVAMLIPSSVELKSFYARFGFEDVAFPIDFSDGVYLGTGDSKDDLAMIKQLR